MQKNKKICQKNKNFFHRKMTLTETYLKAIFTIPTVSLSARTTLHLTKSSFTGTIIKVNNTLDNVLGESY